MMFVGFGHGIKSPFVPGVATAEPLQGQPSTPEGAMGGDRRLGVAGTAGVKAAMVAEKRTYEEPVGADEGDEEGTHGDEANLRNIRSILRMRT